MRGNQFYSPLPIPSNLDASDEAVKRDTYIRYSIYFYFRRRGNDPVTNGSSQGNVRVFQRAADSVKGKFLYGTEVIAGKRGCKRFPGRGTPPGADPTDGWTSGRKRADKGKGVACRLRGKIFRFFHLFTGFANQSRLIVTSIFYELLLKEFRRDRTLKTRGEKKRESKEEGVGKAGCMKRLPSFVQVSLSDLSPALRPLNLPEKRSF